MPLSGGVYTPPAGTKGVPSTPIESTKYNALVDDLALAISSLVVRDGSGPWTGNQNANGNTVTGLPASSANGQPVRHEQLGEVSDQVGLFAACELVKDGTDLRLQRNDGVFLPINGSNQVIPEAGVTLAPTSLTADTLYYIYAYMNSGTMTLEASTTANATDSTTGVSIKTGDATRTMVGWAYPVSGPAFADSTTQRYVRSFFSRKSLKLVNAFTTPRTTATTSFTEVNTEIRVEFIAVPGDTITASLNGFVFNAAAGGYTVSAVGVDGVTTRSPEDGVAALGSSGSAVGATGAFDGLSTGYHYLTYAGRNTTGTGTYGSSTIGLNNSLIAVINPAQR